MFRLYEACDKGKILLSTKESAIIKIKNLYENKNLAVRITRSYFE
jgi:molecular chaperone DnaK (HSP70)